jgi:Viral BACON domain
MVDAIPYMYQSYVPATLAARLPSKIVCGHRFSYLVGLAAVVPFKSRNIYWSQAQVCPRRRSRVAELPHPDIPRVFGKMPKKGKQSVEKQQRNSVIPARVQVTSGTVLRNARFTRVWLRWLMPCLASLVVIIYSPVPANATSNGIAGFSGQTGATCTSCHSSGTVPTVTLTGPMSVSSGSTNTYTVTVTPKTAGNGGLDVSASGGTFTAGTGTKVLGTELVHSAPSSTLSWTFSWTAPTVTTTTTATLYGAAIDSYGGGTGTLKQVITVTAAAPPPTPTLTVSPTTLAFAFTSGGMVPAAKTISVSSSGTALSYTAAASGGSWLSATGSGNTMGNVSVSVNPASMSAGTYNGMVTITSSGASNSPRTVPVSLTVSAPAPTPTLTVSPAALAFSFTAGGTAPAAKTIVVGSSGTALSYTAAASGGSWLSAAGSGTTVGNVSVSVNPSSLGAGTYNGMVTITSSGASSSAQMVPVTLTVSTATPPPTPALTVNPAALAFSCNAGGTAPAAKTISVGSSGTALSYRAAASGGSWLSAAGSGTTLGNVSVSVNPASLGAGTYNGMVTITASGASSSAQMVPVTLTVSAPTTTPPPTGGSLGVSPLRLVFYSGGQDTLSPKKITMSSTGSSLSYTAAAYGGSWLSVTPSAGSTPGAVGVSADATGLPAGTYSGVVQIKAGSYAADVEVVLVVSGSQYGGGSGGGESDDNGDGAQVHPFTFDSGGRGSVSANWTSGAGIPVRSSRDTTQQGLVLVKKNTSPVNAMSGVTVSGAAGSPLTQLGFDIRSDSECTMRAPQFVVVTNDNVIHVAGCAYGASQNLSVPGWKRVSFNPTNSSQVTPAVQPNATVKTVALVMDQITRTGIAVLDNINLNGTLVGKD